MAKFYITTAITYANSKPHLGHAYEEIGTDVLARWHRLAGHEVFFLTGSDEHSANVEARAKAENITPRVFCDRMAEVFTQTWQRLGISYDRFIRTSEPIHHRAAQEMVRRAQAAGDIYQGKYEGWYCKSCETYYLESDLAEGLCPVHRIQPAWLAENNYFFRLSKYTEKIKHHIESHPEFIQPETRRNEMLNILKEGLRDISVSRSSSQWGIPFPGDSSQIVYVWFDALINYISGIGFPDDMPHFEKFWPAEVHVIGKDITRFHCLIWPAMLMSASLPLPKRVFGHGFINLKGEKISKTKGNVLDPLELVDQYGLDAFRYVLLATSHYAGDADFTLPGFIERYNADLANDLGNLLNRTLAMAHKFCQGKVPAYGQEPSAIRLQLERMEGLADRVGSRIEAFDFDGALLQIMDVVNHANKLIDQAAPWALFKQQALDPLGSVMRCLLETLHAVSVLLGPFMPETGIRMRQQLGLPQTEACRLLNGPAVWEQLSIGQELQQGKPIFPRLEVA